MEATNQLQNLLRSWNSDRPRENYTEELDDLMGNNDIDIERETILEDLCQKGADLNYLEKERGISCIPQVFWSKRLIQFFIDRGLSVNSQDEEGDTALQLAINCAFNSGINVAFIHNRNPRPIVEDYFNRNANLIHVPEVINFILNAANVDPNVTNLRGETALFNLACEELRVHANSLEIAKVLVDRGADLETWDIVGYSFFHMHGKFFCIPCQFIEHFEGNIDVRMSPLLDSMTPLMMAAKIGSTKCCQNLIARGADVMAKDIQGFTALHHAISNEQLDCAKVLIDLGANPNIRSASGKDIYELGVRCNCGIITWGAEPMKQIETLELAGARIITRSLNPGSAIEWLEALRLCDMFHLQPSQECLDNAELYLRNPQNLYEMYHAALDTVLRVSVGNSKFWNLLHFAPMKKESPKVFINLERLSEELERFEDFASIEEEDFKTLSELSEFFVRWLNSLIQDERKNEAKEQIPHMHSITKLVIACLKKRIWATNSKTLTHYFTMNTYLEICHMLALIDSGFGEVIPETAFNDNTRLLRTLINLDLRDRDDNTLLHLLFENYGTGKPQFLYTLLHFQNVKVNVRNRLGLEPTQIIYWENQDVNEQFIDAIGKMAFKGAHIDANSKGQKTLRDVIKENSPRMAFNYDTLECACARVLVRNLVPYRNRVPKYVVDFINSHNNS